MKIFIFVVLRLEKLNFLFSYLRMTKIFFEGLWLETKFLVPTA